MFVIAYFLYALAQILDMVIWAYMLIVIARAVLSWVNPDPYNPIVRFLYSVTEPVYRYVRRILRLPSVGIDFSPIIVILVIYAADYFITNTLQDLAIRMR